VLAVVVTFALAPLVSLLRRWLSRPFAIAGAYLLGIGVVIGLAGTLIMAKLVRPFRYRVSGDDPAALLIAISTLVVVGIAASIIPAYRAARVDQATALREQ